MFTPEQIKNQYYENPAWKKLVFSVYPEGLTPENWQERALHLFELCGCTVKETRPYKSEKFKCVMEPELYVNGEFLYSIQLHEHNAIEQLLLDAISGYEVKFEKI